jgi:hypothetical protein
MGALFLAAHAEDLQKTIDIRLWERFLELFLCRRQFCIFAKLFHAVKIGKNVEIAKFLGTKFCSYS